MEFTFTSFQGSRSLSTGDLLTVVRDTKRAFDEMNEPVVVLDDSTSRPVEIDFRSPLESILATLPVTETTPPDSPERRRPGRPKLGVIPREVTLLPRHWEWLGAQPGGASIALRKLVEAASRDPQGIDRIRRARESCYRFMSHMAGDEPGFEEATRALYRGDRETFEALVRVWPADFAAHARRLAAPSFAPTATQAAESPAVG
jgi:hypothetical protein